MAMIKKKLKKLSL